MIVRAVKRTLAVGMLLAVFTNVSAGWALTPEALKSSVDQLVQGVRPGRLPPAATEAVRSFYERRGWRPLWYTETGLSAHGTSLLQALAAAGEHGLEPALYGMPQLDATARAATGDGRAAAELALTRAYLDFADDVASGVIDNPRLVGRVYRDTLRVPPQVLLDGVASATDAASHIASLPADLKRYNALKAGLARYREIQRNGGWEPIARGPSLKPGMRGPRVAQLKRRLMVTGELASLGDPDAYDEALTAAVKEFQRRHGLTEDGAVGFETWTELNVPVAARIDQIIINLERRRWLAAHLDERHIYLNIADNALRVVEGGKTVHVARVIVGRLDQQTPVFSAMMTQIEINPFWLVPHSIATKEMLPIIRRNPNYLAANGYNVFTTQGGRLVQVDPSTVDWSRAGEGSFPYFFRQRPGWNNALGTILFRLPNPYNVFLHDTPSRQLFDRNARFFSHGCMRVENPMKLALLLLGNQDDGVWNEARINATIATRNLTVIPLARPIMVHITYLTAFAEGDGTVHFRRDFYFRDGPLKLAMSRMTYGGRQ